MTAQQQDTLSQAGRSSPAYGLWSLVCGLLAVAGVAMIGQATYEWLAGFDPPGWLHIVVIWLFPIGVVASIALGAISLKRNAGRTSAIAGLALAVLSVAIFIALLASSGY